MGVSGLKVVGGKNYQPEPFYNNDPQRVSEYVWRELNRIASVLGGLQGDDVRLNLSGSTNGKPIPVAATATPGTLIHTATQTANEADEIYLWVSNVTGAAAVLTLEWGGTASTADLLTASFSVAANSAPIQVAFGQPLKGGVLLRAFSGTANALNLTGYVARRPG